MVARMLESGKLLLYAACWAAPSLHASLGVMLLIRPRLNYLSQAIHMKLLMIGAITEQRIKGHTAQALHGRSS